MIVPRFVFIFHSVSRICVLKVVRGKCLILKDYSQHRPPFHIFKCIFGGSCSLGMQKTS